MVQKTRILNFDISIDDLLLPEIKSLLVEAGFDLLSAPQRLAIPQILAGKHVLLIAPTGTGKTEAVIIPVFQLFLKAKSKTRALQTCSSFSVSTTTTTTTTTTTDDNKGISIIYITPLRALNRDMLRRLSKWCAKLGMNLAVRHGDTPPSERALQAEHPPDMLITTPETFQLLFIGKRLIRQLKTVRWLIIDELHELIDNERGIQLTIALERLAVLQRLWQHQQHQRHQHQSEFQRIGLSATIGNPELAGKFLVGMNREVEIINVPMARKLELSVGAPVVVASQSQSGLSSSSQMTASGYNNNNYNTEGGITTNPLQYDSSSTVAEEIGPKLLASVNYCNELIDNHRASLLFVNTRETAELLTSIFNWILAEEESSDSGGNDEGGRSDIKIDYSNSNSDNNNTKFTKVGIHHGSLSSEVRIRMEDEFKHERLKCLICTSSLELGIDIGHVDFVIQYNSPRQVTRLVQRVGRAGHKLGEIASGQIVATTADDVAESVVIARRAIDGELEPARVRHNSLAVLANQLVAQALTSIALNYRRVNASKFYQLILQRAYPYSNLDYEVYTAVLNQLHSIGVLRLFNDGEQLQFTLGRRGRDYYYSNISMIPDERTYQVVDLTTSRNIAKLSESFVTSHLLEQEQKQQFIVRGSSWEVVEINHEEALVIKVRPIRSLVAIPSWVGEDLPVPFEVALEVGKVRREVSQQDEKRWLLKTYPIMINKDAMELFLEYINLQKGYPIGTDKVIVIESGKIETERFNELQLVILNTCFGTRVNETLARVLAGLIGARFGTSVRIQVDPYRIYLELEIMVNPELVGKYLLELQPESLHALLRIILKSTGIFKWQFYHTARKFGIISADADQSKLNIDKLIDSFEGTPVYIDTLNKVLWDYMDIEHTAEVLKRLQSGELKLEYSSKLSPIGLAGYQSRKELLMPPRADRQLLRAVKSRLEQVRFTLVCLQCRTPRRITVGDAEASSLQCFKCGSGMLGVIALSNESTHYWRLTKSFWSDKKILRKLRLTANLLRQHGKWALLTLAGRGVGPDTAARLLAHSYENELELLRAILRAELNYARTRRFWD